jgi:hypothetical protein
MVRKFVQNNLLLTSIFIYFILYVLVNKLNPSLLYKQDGSLRTFGVGYLNKTIVPIWLVSIVLAILSYVLVLYYLAIPKIY